MGGAAARRLGLGGGSGRDRPWGRGLGRGRRGENGLASPTDHCRARRTAGRGLGWAARIGGAGPLATPPGGGRARSPEPEPDTASLRREAASSAAAAGWVPGDLMRRPASRPLPRCRRRTHRHPRPFPGRRPPRLLQLGAAAFSWKTFAKVFMSLRSTFFSSSSDCGHPLGMLLY